MYNADQDADYDPEEQLRRRLTTQYSQDDPTAGAASSADQPVAPAPFDQAPSSQGQPIDTYTPPNYTPPNVVPPTPAPAAPSAAFSGGGGPPQPQDPYYAAYGAEHPGANTAPPVGPQLNYDNSPLAAAQQPAAAGGFDAGAARAAFDAAYGGSRPFDENYWRGVWPSLIARGQQLGDPNYAMKRVQGMGAGPQDFATAGPFANGQGYTQPGNAAPSGALPNTTGGLASYYSNPNQSVAQSFVGGLQQPGGMWNQDFMQQLRQILMQRLQASSQPVDPNAPNIESAMTAARDQASRSTDVERNALAERLYAQGGLNTDALTQQVQQSGERNATALGGLRATLVQKEVDRKQADLRDMMQMALAAGDAESAREIQMQIAALDAMMREEGYGVDLAKFSAGLNQNAALAGMGA
jgi:hypothetical protein